MLLVRPRSLAGCGDLDGVCEKRATAGLVTMWTCYVPGSGAMLAAQRHKRLLHAKLCRAWAEIIIIIIIIIAQLKF